MGADGARFPVATPSTSLFAVRVQSERLFSFFVLFGFECGEEIEEFGAAAGGCGEPADGGCGSDDGAVDKGGSCWVLGFRMQAPREMEVCFICLI